MHFTAKAGPAGLPRLSMLDRQQCAAIHLASLEILRRTGFRVYCDEALALCRQTDALITGGNLVRMPRSLVEWALWQARPRVVLCPRGSNTGSVCLQASEVYFGPGSDCPNYLDARSGEHRRYTLADVIDSIRVVDALPEIDFCMPMGLPAELDADTPYRHQFALMLQYTTKPCVLVGNDRADCEAITAMAAAAAGGEAELTLNPTLLLYSEPSTPLRHSRTATEKLLFMAERGLPVVHSPAPMMGGTAPMSIAGALALRNADLLSSLVLHQLRRPGAPFVYDVQVHHLDMKAMVSVYGAPEYQLARVMSAEMGRYYGLPTCGNAGMTDSCVLDEQAASDVTFSILVALLSGTNLVHDVGYMEAGLTTSPELMVFSAEIIAMMRRFAVGADLDAASLALEVIHHVGPG
jgi:trimethylamine---corrinoid protein Co-methyltransferase